MTTVGPTGAVIIGIAPGKAVVTMGIQTTPSYDPKQPDLYFKYSISVEGPPPPPDCDYQAIAAAIAQLFPGSKVSLEPQSASRNLLVKGKVRDGKQEERILAFIKGIPVPKPTLLVSSNIQDHPAAISPWGHVGEECLTARKLGCGEVR